MAESMAIIQLIDLSSKVLSGCYRYIRAVKNAPKEIQSILEEVSTLNNIFQNLKHLSEEIDEERFALLNLLNRSDSSFSICADNLEELSTRLDNVTSFTQVQRRLLWPVELKSIHKILEKLRQHKLLLILALAGDSASLQLATQGSLNEIKSSVEQIKVVEERSKILQWLKGTDPSINYNAAAKKRESGTCEWLLHSSQFKEFMNGENNLMWLHGMPGAGKTVLNSAVIQYLSSRSLETGHRVIYYYFDFSDSAKQTCIECVKSLTWQLMTKRDIVPEPIRSMYEECAASSPSLTQLKNCLRDMLAEEPKTYIALDALDECIFHDGQDEKLEMLDILQEFKLDSGPIGIFVTSRPEVSISRRMVELCDIDLDVQAALVDADIRHYVRSCLEKDPKLRRWPEPVKADIETTLTGNSQGMFQWVACQLTELRKCLKLPNIRNELKALPKTLDATYQRIIHNISPMYQRELRTTLMLLAFSYRPVTIQEVAEATAVDVDSKRFSPDDRFGDPYDILEVCSSLVSVGDVPFDLQRRLRDQAVVDSGPLKSTARILQFAHFSVKEYILSERAHRILPQSLQIDAPLSHSYIMRACLIYISDFSNGEKLTSFNHREFPFLSYSALYWTKHLLRMTENDRAVVDEFLIQLFDPNNTNNLMNLLNLCEPDQVARMEIRMGKLSRNLLDFSPAIYYACYHGLVPVVKYLLSGNRKPSKSVMGSGLAAAASEGFTEIVLLLLSEGADPNSPYCGKFWRPLHAAAFGGNPEIVKLLLAAGSLVNAHNSHEGGALHVAAEQGNVDVIQLLIDGGHDLHSWSEFNGPPLSKALQRGKFDAAATLIRNGADVNIPPDGYHNPLNLACENCSIEAVRLVLDSGGVASLKLSSSWALHAAAERGDTPLIQLLLDKGADINMARGGTYGTPLKAAIQSRNATVFDFMVRNGADINEKGSTSEHPIDQAIFGGNIYAAEKLIELDASFSDYALEQALDYDSKEFLAKMLLDKGANPNAEHRQHGNILGFAAFKSSQISVRWLLEAGADPNDICGGEYGTPLQYAAHRGNESVVKLLLGYGAEVNPQNLEGVYGTPLQAAVQNGNRAIIELLLDNDAEVDKTGGELGTPLQAASSNGLLDVAKTLIRRGANINCPPCGLYGTPLRAALASNHENLVRYLLESGADMNVRYDGTHTICTAPIYEKYSSVLEIAAGTNNPKLVQLLMDHGLELNSDGEACSRSITRASQQDDCTMLEMLVQRGADIKQYGAAALSEDINRHDGQRFEKIQLLLKQGANPNGDPNCKITPLASSIVGEHWDVMQLLLENGCDVNASYPEWHGSALHETIYQGNVEVTKELLRRGADVNLRAGTDGTPLTCAAYKGDEEAYHILLEHGADVDPNPPYGYYGTPLQAAILKNYYNIAHELLDKGASAIRPSFNTSVLTTACGSGKDGQLDLIKRLISLGVSMSAEDEHRSEDDIFNWKRIYLDPLQNAVWSGNEEIVTYLLEVGAPLNPASPQGTYGYPLQIACSECNESMTRLLLEKGADINAVGGKFGTALQAATAQRSDALINLLLAAGADVKVEGGYYGSPLQAASRLGITRHVETFLKHGALVNTKVGKYGNPLAAAAKGANISTVKLLIANGANVNLLGGKYGTPLQAACCATGSSAKNEAGSVVKLLIEKGANINVTGVGKYGTALQAAVAHNKAYVQVLLHAGVDPNIWSEGKYRRPLEIARQKKLPRVERLLLEYGAKEESSS